MININLHSIIIVATRNHSSALQSQGNGVIFYVIAWQIVYVWQPWYPIRKKLILSLLVYQRSS